MAVAVRIPTILRTYTKGESDVSVEVPDDATLAVVVETLEASYPGLMPRLLDDTGALRRFVNVYVNDDDVRFADGLATPTPDGTKISVIPAVAGG
jgi:molybdopterin converting factor small subunit